MYILIQHLTSRTSYFYRLKIFIELHWGLKTGKFDVCRKCGTKTGLFTPGSLGIWFLLPLEAFFGRFFFLEFVGLLEVFSTFSRLGISASEISEN